MSGANESAQFVFSTPISSSKRVACIMHPTLSRSVSENETFCILVPVPIDPFSIHSIWLETIYGEVFEVSLLPLDRESFLHGS